MVQIVGIDIGSQKTMMVRDDAEIIRTDTGSISRPTLVSFLGRSRLVGEEAAAQLYGDSTIAMFNLLIGSSISDLSAIFDHQKIKSNLKADSQNRLLAHVNYCDNMEAISITSVVGMFIAKLFERIVADSGDDVLLSFALPASYSPSMARAYQEACEVAGVPASKIFFVNSADSLVATYERKLNGILPADRAAMEGKQVVLVDMGHTQTTIVVVQVCAADNPTGGLKKISVGYDASLGAHHFDLKLYEHFAKIVESKGMDKVVPATKRGLRLLAGCERIRKLLSQLPEASITVENMSDNGDINFHLKRDDLITISSDLMDRFKGLLRNTIMEGVIKMQENTHSITPVFTNLVEVLGGGVRMQLVQSAITEVMMEQQLKMESISQKDKDIVLGAKLDDASVALGAALLALKYCNEVSGIDVLSNLQSEMKDDSSEGLETQVNAVINPESSKVLSGTQIQSVGYKRKLEELNTPSVGLNEEEISLARSKELEMQSLDAEVRSQLAAKNALEAYILDIRTAPRRKFGNLIANTDALNEVLDEYEGWMWDTPDATTGEVHEKMASLQQKVSELCSSYFEAIAKEKTMLEKSLEDESQKAAAEKGAEGDDEDHDNRKLKKADRMRLVVKNKEEGTELFKGGNYRPAAARYHKALTHCAKFFDLSKEDEDEVKELKKTLYLNLASCYIKLESWDQVLRNCDEALGLDENNIKALFRRSTYHEYKKDWDSALIDLKRCQEMNDTEDKLVTKALERVKKEIQKEKNKEKKMWGKAFA